MADSTNAPSLACCSRFGIAPGQESKMTNKAIGVLLDTSDRTAQGHLRRIFEKLTVADRTEENATRVILVNAAAAAQNIRGGGRHFTGCAGLSPWAGKPAQVGQHSRILTRPRWHDTLPQRPDPGCKIPRSCRVACREHDRHQSALVSRSGRFMN
jgi:hypothetical protein